MRSTFIMMIATGIAAGTASAALAAKPKDYSLPWTMWIADSAFHNEPSWQFGVTYDKQTGYFTGISACSIMIGPGTECIATFEGSGKSGADSFSKFHFTALGHWSAHVTFTYDSAKVLKSWHLGPTGSVAGLPIGHQAIFSNYDGSSLKET
ncbi:uncharacterized protein L969DRAFT_463165 [Mixia osmundae IAM 14324]|uniref:Uncharacterized protein n=1 Tax=Mixia osmundae (strain CBS 9802 / IAM 14324 / JCM 22182 / KY 12970) TaxID=764103 RepID=G7E452_MIXOS|nr:uncharacterized protein L969DRAFT_463165 [Mixia osmundae IAM 14324]KEI39707.1 hypothetical protein L969DRAFT_463165 [Mixia osmundae IAM 14324]GAA97612.1 hypothetical protein E5Q_04290 [Mixia osmundae IAM 14324]